VACAALVVGPAAHIAKTFVLLKKKSHPRRMWFIGFFMVVSTKYHSNAVQSCTINSVRYYGVWRTFLVMEVYKARTSRWRPSVDVFMERLILSSDMILNHSSTVMKNVIFEQYLGNMLI
jgi:hypothetical protein